MEAKGIAFIINKCFIKIDSLDIEDVIPGRVAILHMDWKSGWKLAILNMYTPNPPQENRQFWRDIQVRIEARRSRRLEIMLGDFNLVETSMDRLPTHADRKESVEHLQGLLSSLSVTDGW